MTTTLLLQKIQKGNYGSGCQVFFKFFATGLHSSEDQDEDSKVGAGLKCIPEKYCWHDS